MRTGAEEAESSRVPVVATIGMATVDYLYFLDAHPQADSENRVREHRIAVGGQAGRSAIAARRLGGPCKLLAARGTGVHAEVLSAQLEAEGVECTWFTYAQPSQHSAIIVAREDATRTTIWLPQPMADARMLQQLPAFLDGVDVALLDATDERLTRAALDECRRREVTTVIDTGSGRPWLRELLGRVDHVVAPEKFVLRETGHAAEEAVVELWGDACRTVFVVTQGPRGGVFAAAKDPERVGRWDAAPVTAVDTCGAGDTFHGAYAWAVARGLTPAECVDIARWSAGLKASRLGNDGIPTLEQLDEARESHLAGTLD